MASLLDSMSCLMSPPGLSDRGTPQLAFGRPVQPLEHVGQ